MKLQEITDGVFWKFAVMQNKNQHWDETLVPMGILEIESGKSTVIVGNSNETSDFIVDGFEKWYEIEKEKLNFNLIHTLEIYADNGPAIHSHRTQFIKRMMEFACITNLNIHLIYYPPYHSKYNPIERVWAAVESRILGRMALYYHLWTKL